VRDFDFPPGRFSHIIHAATESTSGLNERDPLLMLDSIVGGTRRTLDFAVASGARKFLLTSSGAVYGKQPPELTHVPESYAGAPDPLDPHSAYGEGKRVAELLCSIYCQRHGLETKIARCFAFVGPHLPLDVHFAIGNFIRDQLAGGPIRVNGDGTPFRSYLYAADLAIWLWTILVKGEPCRAYNVGSERHLTIAQLGASVASALGGDRGLQIGTRPVPGLRTKRYVPATHRVRGELGLREYIALDEAIRRTASHNSPALAARRVS
jgi:dTDP-glucose 4,6-dehydratase